MKQNGYRPSHRNRWLLIHTKLLNIQELCLWELYLDQMDFDKSHKDYGCVKSDFKQIAEILGYSSINSVRETKHKKLVDIGLVIETSQPGVFKIPNPDRYIPAAKAPNLNGKAHEFVKLETNQSIEFILQNFGVKTQYIDGLAQRIDVKSPFDLEFNLSKALSSFKGVSKVSSKREGSGVLKGRDDKPPIYTKDQWERLRLDDPTLPSWENKLLIEESVAQCSPISDEYKYNLLKK